MRGNDDDDDEEEGNASREDEDDNDKEEAEWDDDDAGSTRDGRGGVENGSLETEAEDAGNGGGTKTGEYEGCAMSRDDKSSTNWSVSDT